ncbi:MAG: hypothetical protein CMI79_03730 [Candidatus Pelagibacter sp.]|nr:hypothetical protein [Candidatus Pelagibacter sp.]|tara:strand:+ start:5545 stop:6357 length:813 start_codon:yes stop_codon:yes gene_type:complete
MSLNIHNNIIKKLDYFLENGKIPNIVFYGPHGSGKRTIVTQFLNKIYGGNKESIKSYVLFANCSHGKGIRFVREDLKFFAKTHINLESDNCFKTVILANADSLTIDAQSALRRCIEQYSATTRFFVIVTDKAKLLNPILSRFCEVYIPCPQYKNNRINLHEFKNDKTYGKEKDTNRAIVWIKKNIKNIDSGNFVNIMQFADKMYEKCYSGLDLLAYIEQCSDIPSNKRYKLLIMFHKVKKDFRNEKLFITFILNYLLIRSDDALENVSFM